MLSHFAILGDLYKHDPYDTLATEWNTYPWSIGQDNYLDQVESEAESATMEKMIWRFNDGDYFNVVRPSAIISTIDMWTALISIDNFGNFGSQAGSLPDTPPSSAISVSALGASITSMSTEELLKTFSVQESEPEPSGIGDLSSIGSNLLIMSTSVVLVASNTNEEAVWGGDGLGAISNTSTIIEVMTSSII